ncbi:MAG: type II secretion system protein [Alphaproteobacteria bacterium]
MKNPKGFSLLEVAIALCIMGVLMSAGIPLLTHFIYLKKQNITEENINHLKSVMASYVLIHKKLPSPASPKDTSQSIGTASDNCFIGIVPYRTLGLSQKYAKDGYGYWITYAVHPLLTSLQLKYLSTDDETILPNQVFCEIKNNASPITVLDQQNVSVVSSQFDMVAFVLIHHGPKGQGSFMTPSGKRYLTNSSNKAKNADDSLNFMDLPLSSDFDDHVHWITRNNILSIYAKSPCNPRAVG